MMKGRMELGELEEVPQHHAAQGGVLEIWVPGVKQNMGVQR